MKYQYIKISVLLLSLLLSSLLHLNAQDKEATSGTISGILGNPIAEVTIESESGKVLGTTTVHGTFDLPEPFKGKAFLKKDGFEIAEIYLVPGERNNFSLKANLLNEDMSIGYGFRKRYNVISSVSTVSDERLSRFSVTKPSSALYGILPGLIVEEQPELIGSSTPNMWIRGRSTYGSASNVPIVLVDGIIRDIDDVNIDDIASVSVLKDASSAAIYGMRGANGVVLVETKRGAIGRPRYKVSIDQGFLQPVGVPDFVSSAQYARLYNQALTNDNLPIRFSDERIAEYEAGNTIYSPDNQWVDMLTKSIVPTTKINMSATGGSELAKYYVSLKYRRENGIFKDTKHLDYNANPKNDQLDFRANLDITAINNLDIKLDISGIISNQNQPYYGQDALWDLMYKYPQHEFPGYLPNGDLGGTSTFRNNPIGALQRRGVKEILDRTVLSTLTAEYHLQGALEGLSFGGTYAYDNSWYVANYKHKSSFSVKEIIGKKADGSPALQTIGTDQNLNYWVGSDEQSRRETIEGFVKFKKNFGAYHNLDASFIYHQDALTMYEENPYKNQYWGGRVGYGYDSKYLAELTFSYSGTEAFIGSNRYQFYPGAALGWVVSKEEFMNNPDVINFLKLRMSGGMLGNSEVAERFSYRQLTTTIGNNYYFGKDVTGQTGRKLSTLANANLGAEKAYKFDLGVDAQLLNSLYFSGTFFYEKRTDILTNLGNTMSAVSGIIYPNINAGKAQNVGLDMQLNYNKQVNRDWTLFGDLSFLTYKNKILSILESELPDNASHQYRRHTGIEENLGLALVFDGFFQTQAEIDASPVQEYGPVRTGDIKYKDVNGDGVINDYDRVYSGKSNMPTTELGLNLGTKYKNFDFSAYLHAQLGSEVYLGDMSSLTRAFSGDSYRVTQWVADRVHWTPETAGTANYPRLSISENSNNFRRSDFWVKNGDRLRLRSLEVGYTLPPQIADRLLMSDCRFYLRGMNLLTLDHLDGIDPAAKTSTPMMRSYHIGCSINF